MLLTPTASRPLMTTANFCLLARIAGRAYFNTLWKSSITRFWWLGQTHDQLMSWVAQGILDDLDILIPYKDIMSLMHVTMHIGRSTSSKHLIYVVDMISTGCSWVLQKIHYPFFERSGLPLLHDKPGRWKSYILQVPLSQVGPVLPEHTGSLLVLRLEAFVCRCSTLHQGGSRRWQSC